MKNREKTEENGKLSASSMEHGYGVPVAEFEHIIYTVLVHNMS